MVVDLIFFWNFWKSYIFFNRPPVLSLSCAMIWPVVPNAIVFIKYAVCVICFSLRCINVDLFNFISNVICFGTEWKCWFEMHRICLSMFWNFSYMAVASVLDDVNISILSIYLVMNEQMDSACYSSWFQWNYP